MTKKKGREKWNFGGWKWEIFSGKGKISEIFQKVKKIIESRGGNLKQGENASWPLGGMDAPEWQRPGAEFGEGKNFRGPKISQW